MRGACMRDVPFSGKEGGCEDRAHVHVCVCLGGGGAGARACVCVCVSVCLCMWVCGCDRGRERGEWKEGTGGSFASRNPGNRHASLIGLTLS
jgi:hypothetical protein